MLSIGASALLFAQQYIDVTDETFTVNSATSLTGNTRNISHVSLPEKAIGYIYRISVFSKGNTNVPNALFKVIKTIDPSTALTTSLMEYAINNNDGKSVDAFIFNNTYDADNFYAKKDNNWNACRSLMNRSNCCFATKECLNHVLYFGFRNNNISKGLDVKLEVVAIVDTTTAAKNKFSYSISNGASVNVKYFLSLDVQNWTENNLRPGYQNPVSIDQPQLFIKVYTTQANFVQYKMIPDNRYKIVYNTQTRKWDVIYY